MYGNGSGGGCGGGGVRLRVGVEGSSYPTQPCVRRAMQGREDGRVGAVFVMRLLSEVINTTPPAFPPAFVFVA